jgi:hypothetical protein
MWRTEKLDPIFRKSRVDIAEPSLNVPKSDNPSFIGMHARDRMDTLLPIFRKSSTEN